MESEYVKFDGVSDSNGFKRLDLDKIESMVSCYAEHISGLYKVKLMKLLWYADALLFKTYGNSMAGLVYRHESMGALPLLEAHDTGKIERHFLLISPNRQRIIKILLEINEITGIIEYKATKDKQVKERTGKRYGK